ncbi:hypothetical protein ACN9MZ_25085 [Pseudoduganella sp. S-14]|uniref:hypothetical protein n=1 Tax=Pseudoduganella sp. S-14 TaxID=3404065 RepID=UPI003CFB759B
MGKLGLGVCALLLSVSQGACAALLSSSEAIGAGSAGPAAGPEPFDISASDDGAPAFEERLADQQEFPFSPPGSVGRVRTHLGSMMLDVDPALVNNVLSGSKYEMVDDSARKPTLQALCGMSLVLLLAFRAAARFSGKRRRRRR